MAVSVIVLNGGSSSGKSTIARTLQDVLLPEPWLTFGIDTLIAAMPPSLGSAGEGLDLRSDGSISVGDGFRLIEGTWHQGLGAMAAAGSRVVIDDVFLGGADSQARLRQALGPLDVLWVGVHCSLDELARRERARGDRVIGQAAFQAEVVHRGVVYDVEVDTTHTDARRCAEAIAAHLSR
jgi:chloramphenicol 3-O phosphotransferase